MFICMFNGMFNDDYTAPYSLKYVGHLLLSKISHIILNFSFQNDVACPSIALPLLRLILLLKFSEDYSYAVHEGNKNVFIHKNVKYFGIVKQSRRWV